MKEPKLKTVYVCSNCGETSPRWMGRCPSCGSWNTMNEDVVAETPKAGLSGGKSAAPARQEGVTSLTARRLADISTTEEKSRILTGISELDRVLGGGIVLGGVGCVAAEWILRVVSTPEDIFDLALTYLYIYFAGTPAIMLYNYGAAALRARGDTRRPLIFLTISGVVNVALNLFFVIACRMDVAGVALATVISESLSAVLILICLMRTDDELHFSWRQLRIDRRSLIRMSKIGIPAGIQSCLFSLSNVAIQSAINAYGSVVIAGCSAASSIEGFIYVAMNSFHQAAQTFMSQNIGAGKYDRIRDILKRCILCTVVTGAALSALTLLLNQPLLRIYNEDPAVIAAGGVHLYMVATLYFIFGIADVLTGAIRGCGSPVAPVVINLLCTCVLRLLWVAVIDTNTMPISLVYASYPASWILLLTVLTFCWRRLYRKQILPNIT